MRVSMTDRDIVERVGRLLDRAIVPLRARQEHHKRPFVVTIQGAPAVELMKALFNHVGAKRRAEIRRAILSWATRRSRRRRRPSASTVLDAAQTCDEACDFAWLVGLLEGEGTFSTARTRGHAYPVLKVSMCTEDVVSRAARLLGVPSVTRVEPEREDWSVSYVAAVSGSDAAALMRGPRTHMGHRRTEAIDAALSRYHPVRLVDPPESCVAPGCSEPHRGRGLCHKHYMMVVER